MYMPSIRCCLGYYLEGSNGWKLWNAKWKKTETFPAVRHPQAAVNVCGRTTEMRTLFFIEWKCTGKGEPSDGKTGDIVNGK